MDIQSIQGKAILDKNVLRRVLGSVEPVPLGREANLYDVGYEAAKRDLRAMLITALPKNKQEDPLTSMIKELR